MRLKPKLAAAVVVTATLSLAAVNLDGRLSAPESDPAFVATAASDGVQAAVLRGWGRVVAGDEFSYVGAPDPQKWKLYDGLGHAGKGIRSPKAWNVAN
jgi:hypothetical protein